MNEELDLSSNFACTLIHISEISFRNKPVVIWLLNEVSILGSYLKEKGRIIVDKILILSNLPHLVD